MVSTSGGQLAAMGASNEPDSWLCSWVSICVQTTTLTLNT